MNALATKTERDSPAFSGAEERWEAVTRREGAADGSFYYGVRTTGVYCRPSCPSRLARRENVEFHLTSEAAERAGYRPCKRCRPDGAPLTSQHAAAVENACRTIESAEILPSLEELAAAVGMSRYYFHRVFKATTGVTPKVYGLAHRTQKVRDALPQTATVTEAIYGAGFQSSGRFYAKSSEVLGMTPSQFRSGGNGAAMRFAVGECSLGSVLVAATDKGVAAIWFGDDPNALVRDLQDRFPKTHLVGGDREFEQVVAKVISYVEEPALGLGLPLDVRGTAFQQRVWRALREVPAGGTATYLGIADRIGAPKAARAVASACASNVIAVAIPCHRVVRNDGTLSGYRWGMERKRMLLERDSGL